MKSPTKDGTMLDNVKHGKLVDNMKSPTIVGQCWIMLNMVNTLIYNDVIFLIIIDQI
jgi:hypothetical protein